MFVINAASDLWDIQNYFCISNFLTIYNKTLIKNTSEKTSALPFTF